LKGKGLASKSERSSSTEDGGSASLLPASRSCSFNCLSADAIGCVLSVFSGLTGTHHFLLLHSINALKVHTNPKSDLRTEAGTTMLGFFFNFFCFPPFS